jgi:hypothetical protein
VNQNISHAAQLNSYQLKRHLLVWLIGLSFFNFFLLVVVVLLINVSPTLLHRCANWKARAALHKRQHLMKKHNLVEQSPLTVIATHPSHLLSEVANTAATDVAVTMSTYAELSRQIENQQQLLAQLTRDLQAERALHKMNTFAPRPKID